MNSIGKWVRNIMLGAVIVAFVLVFGQPGGGGNVSGAVAEINGEEIPRDVFEFFRERTQENRRDYLASLDADRATDLLDNETRGSLIRRYVIAQEAQELGLRVPDAALSADIQRNPNFQRDGRYDRELAETFVARTGLGTREYMEQHRRDLLIRNFSRLVTSTVRVSDAAVREEIMRNETTLKLRYVTAAAEAFRDRVEVTEEQADALVSSDPEKIRALYNARLSEFQREEELAARHILLTGPDATAHALQARARIEAGEDFAAVARDVSQDPATREQGGDLGRFPRGRMRQAFDEVAFLLEVGQLSGPVETERGTHLILVEAHQEALETPFESVARDLSREVLIGERADFAAKKALARMMLGVRAGKQLEDLAKAEKLPVQVTPPFRLSDGRVPGLEDFPDALDAAFALSPDVPHMLGSRAQGGRYQLISLLERSEPDEDAIQAALEPTRERLLARARQLTSGLWFNERRRALEQNGQLQLYPLYPQN